MRNLCSRWAARLGGSALCSVCLLTVGPPAAVAQGVQFDVPPPAWRSIGEANLKGWTGVSPQARDAEMSVPGRASYRYADGPKGFYYDGLRMAYDGGVDVRPYYGLRLAVRLDQDRPFEARLTLTLPPQTGRHNMLDSTVATVQVQGRGWHTLLVPLGSFDYNRGQQNALKYIKQLTIRGRYLGAPAAGRVALRDVRLVLGNPVALLAPVHSRPAGPDSTVTYQVRVTNSAETPQRVRLTLQRTGWEGMAARVEPTQVELAPGQSLPVMVRVTVPARIPPGAQETQTLLATPTGTEGAPATLSLITSRAVLGLNLTHTDAGWQAVQAKVRQYAWAKEELAKLVARADAFEVPVVPPGQLMGELHSPALFKPYTENGVWPCAVAWKLTGERKYADKVALFLNRLADPKVGYPSTRMANSAGMPQEGGFFRVAACSYELLRNTGILTRREQQLVENTLRLYIETLEDDMGGGGISNWTLFNLCPAAECALVLQDMDHFNYLLNAPTGLVDHLRYGMMDDGWWYEMSLSYNLGCAEDLTRLGIAAQPFGIDLLHAQWPVATTQNVGLRPFEYENFQGMAFGKFGPVTHNYVDIKRMWDGIVAYPDYRGIMFGMGDGHEQQLAGGAFELAYFAYRDTTYAAVIKRTTERDLLYGLPVLPARTPKLYDQSAHSDNAGIAVLRSQTAGRPPREQIQAALKYGAHGSYHGHFDRASTVSLMRYGRSFWNPETSWFGYGSYMYKWWIQPSLAHNMVVVDAKMQEPKESRPLLFHSGPMLQVMGAETKARWSNPPYLGGYDQLAEIQAGTKPYVPVPANHPVPTAVTDYTEPVTQRRLLIVTDDYVVQADYLQGTREHTFDNLLHLRGAQPAADLRLLGHTAQLDANPLGSGQFITNVNHYQAKRGARINSIMRAGTAPAGQQWGTGGYNHLNEPGELRIDAYHLWPAKGEVLIGDYAESWPVNKKLEYEVRGDDKALAAGKLGTWLLGAGTIDVDLRNQKTLTLQTRTDRRTGTLSTLFWANARLVTASGKEIPLSQLKPSSTNVAAVPTPGQDYAGGPIRIAGLSYADALAAEPQDAGQPGQLSFDLSNLGAVRLKATVGGDWPVGNEEQLRKVTSLRTTGKEARFLTVIEPYETTSVIKQATALSADRLRVELTDGRVQEITISNLAGDGQSVRVSIQETRNGQVLRTETTVQPAR